MLIGANKEPLMELFLKCLLYVIFANKFLFWFSARKLENIKCRPDTCLIEIPFFLYGSSILIFALFECRIQLIALLSTNQIRLFSPIIWLQLAYDNINRKSFCPMVFGKQYLQHREPFSYREVFFRTHWLYTKTRLIKNIITKSKTKRLKWNKFTKENLQKKHVRNCQRSCRSFKLQKTKKYMRNCQISFRSCKLQKRKRNVWEIIKDLLEVVNNRKEMHKKLSKSVWKL